MKKDTATHVTFEEESSAVEKGMGRVAAGVETVEEAAAMAGSKIASYVPGTAEHAIRKGKKELEATGDIHVADGERRRRLNGLWTQNFVDFWGFDPIEPSKYTLTIHQAPLYPQRLPLRRAQRPDPLSPAPPFPPMPPTPLTTWTLSSMDLHLLKTTFQLSLRPRCARQMTWPSPAAAAAPL
jgi:hypothetical protein